MQKEVEVSGKKKGKYRQSFVVVGLVMIAGLLLDLIGFTPIKMPAFPFNLYWGLGFINLMLISYLAFRNHRWLVWLSSVPASVAAIIFYTFLILSMGFIPQEGNADGMIGAFRLDQVISSWSFFLLQLFFLITLGMVTLKRSIPFKWKNWGFILNHLGLWLIIFAAALGSGDFKRLKMAIPEGESENVAVAENNQAYRMPFSIGLQDFMIREYPPKLALINLKERKIISTVMINASNPDNSYQLLDWKVNITPSIMHHTTGLVQDTNGEEKSKFLVIASQNGQQHTGNLTPGAGAEANLMQLSNQRALTILPPEPQEFISEITLSQHELQKEALVKVNHPVKFAGWNIYQFSYDQAAGKHSKYTVLELIRDPWLPVIYFALGMMTIGAIYLGWMANQEKSKHHGVE